MHSASSISRTASIKVGYLEDESASTHREDLSPFFDDMVQAIYRFIVL